ncbi:MAG: amidase [Fimbriimonadaceae bacterium]
MPELSRKEFIASALALSAGGIFSTSASGQNPPAPQDEITLDDLKAAEKLFGLTFTDAERAAALGAVRGSRRTYDALRAHPISYQIEPPLIFTPLAEPERGRIRVEAKPSGGAPKKPSRTEDMAYLSVRELGHLIRTKQVSPVELTKMYLSRINRYGDKLLCIVSATEERAIAQAEELEREIIAGKYRGPLHGIPYGLKDLFATRGYKTTWGSEPHKDQYFDFDAAVVERLDKAGAILVAKTSVGALAQGDLWFKGRTKNPWNPARGSSGSSAGSSAGVAAGLFGFGIGTETMGSLMSPSLECRVTGLRPTYGRISRHGGMAVSWTMDKVGPLCREAEDCALVFAAICGYDARDRTTVDRSFVYPPRIDVKKLKIGYTIGATDDPSDLSRLERDDYLKALVKLGASPKPIKFDPLLQGVNLILGIESAAAFDEFTRSDRDDLLTGSTWPNTYRQNRYPPAVEYLQAQRARTLSMRRFEEQWGDLDIVIANERGGPLLFMTNYTGHPQVLVPNGVDERGNGRGVSLFARPYQEALLVAVARALQEQFGHHRVHPKEETWG